jgi:hypothetical protein
MRESLYILTPNQITPCQEMSTASEDSVTIKISAKNRKHTEVIRNALAGMEERYPGFVSDIANSRAVLRPWEHLPEGIEHESKNLDLENIQEGASIDEISTFVMNLFEKIELKLAVSLERLLHSIRCHQSLSEALTMFSERETTLVRLTNRPR